MLQQFDDADDDADDDEHQQQQKKILLLLYKDSKLFQAIVTDLQQYPR
jgi:hypothetical protein